MSIDRWMDKVDVVHIQNGILLSHKNEWDHAICSNMDGHRYYHTKWSKSEREIKISHDITYIKMIQMNLFTKQKQPHRLQKQTWLLKGKGGGEVN